MSQSLDEFFATRDLAALQGGTGWSVSRDERDPARVVLSVAARDGQVYRALFLCNGYPLLAPSMSFVNDDGSKLDARAWPHGDADFLGEVKPPPNAFVCVPLTREGLQHHPEWATSGAKVWNPEVHTLMDLFNYTQRLLNSGHYLGRGGA